MNNIYGTSGDDTLIGTSGNDYLDGGTGTDTLIGGGGDDVYIVNNPNDVVVEEAGGGSDRVISLVSYSLSANVENLWLIGTLDNSGVGNELDNSLLGNSGSNTLAGLAGNDYIDGGAGADIMIGGTGDDTYWVDNAGDQVIENANEGSDTVNSSLANYTLPANVENLTLIAGAGDINGSGNELDNILTGNEGNNVLTGLAGNDSIDGGAGADTMIGGTGDDTYRVDNAGDLVIENAGEGNDTVIASVSYTLPANVENLVLKVGAGDINGTGNDLGNHLTGNEGNNVLTGGAGNDYIDGRGGNDTLVGGGGQDVFYISTAYSGKVEIADLVSGDTMQVCGAQLFGAISAGDGSSLKPGDLQVSVTDNKTTLHVGVDPVVGHNVDITLDGVYSASNFTMSGFEIHYDTNHPPTLVNQPPDQAAFAGQALSIKVPPNMFTDPDGDAMTYSASLIDPDWGGGPLPSWLKFDPSTMTLSGTPGTADIGAIFVQIMATDTHGASNGGAFQLTVGATPVDTTPPTVSFSDDTTGTASGLVTYTLAFSEAVTGLTANDFAVTNGSIGSISGSGMHYTVAVSPKADTEGSLHLTLKAGAVSDAAGNPNASSSADPQRIDTKVSTHSPNEHALAAADSHAFGVVDHSDNGNSSVEGSAGIDIAAFSSSAKDCSFSLQDDGSILVTGANGSATLHNVERLHFPDATLAVDLGQNQSGGESALLIGAVVGKSPLTDKALVGAVLQFFDAGHTMHDAANFLVDNGVMDALAGGSSTHAYVNLIYYAVVGQVATADITALLSAYIDGGTYSKADFLAVVADLPINQTNINLVGLAHTGLEYSPAS